MKERFIYEADRKTRPTFNQMNLELEDRVEEQLSYNRVLLAVHREGCEDVRM